MFLVIRLSLLIFSTQLAYTDEPAALCTLSLREQKIECCNVHMSHYSHARSIILYAVLAKNGVASPPETKKDVDTR